MQPTFTFGFDVKEMFFDRKAVERAIDKPMRDNLSKAGAHVRQVAKSSIVENDGVSPPGHAPYSHAGHLKRLIYFAYDRGTKAVWIGPILFATAVAKFKKWRGKTLHSIMNSSKPVPQLLEEGGTATMPESNTSGFWQRMKSVTYAPRPYMEPALRHEAPNFPHLWAETVKP